MWRDNHHFGRKSRLLQSHPHRFWWLQFQNKFTTLLERSNLCLGPRWALCSKHLRRWDRCTVVEHDIGLERRSSRSFPAKAATVLATHQWPPSLGFVQLQIWTKDFRNSSSLVWYCDNINSSTSLVLRWRIESVTPFPCSRQEKQAGKVNRRRGTLSPCTSSLY